MSRCLDAWMLVSAADDSDREMSEGTERTRQQVQRSSPVSPIGRVENIRGQAWRTQPRSNKPI
ncbi:unnamed protein product [Pylaiella littoralis]